MSHVTEYETNVTLKKYESKKNNIGIEVIQHQLLFLVINLINTYSIIMSKYILRFLALKKEKKSLPPWSFNSRNRVEV